MQLVKNRSQRGDLLEIRHQIPGRTRLRVPALGKAKEQDLGARVAAALESVEGIHSVRLNGACSSLVIHHRPDFTPTCDHLKGALTPILMPAAPISLPQPKASKRVDRVKPRPEKTKARGETPRKRVSERALAGCPICQLKLKAARWILSDFWRCWRDHWTQRLHGRLLASVALFRP